MTITAHPCIAVVGVNAVGKSNFGRRLASRLKRPRIDTDTVFRQRHGGIAAFLESHGWGAFRRAEEAIVLETLQPGRVVVLGGGAIESVHIRHTLQHQSIVVWLHAGPDRVLRHLQEARRPRPEFPPPITRAKVAEVLHRWDPLFREVATVTIDDHVPFARQIPVALRLLGNVCPEIAS